LYSDASGWITGGLGNKINLKELQPSYPNSYNSGISKAHNIAIRILLEL
jgi:hypothetical protein